MGTSKYVERIQIGQVIYVLMMIFSMLIFGGSKNSSEKWVAVKDIQTYSSTNGPESFVIEKGEICAKGQYSYGKADRYIEVSCARGNGWISATRACQIFCVSRGREIIPKGKFHDRHDDHT